VSSNEYEPSSARRRAPKNFTTSQRAAVVAERVLWSGKGTGKSLPPRGHPVRRVVGSEKRPIQDLQALAGHATAAFTLQRYTHHYAASARRPADAMGYIIPDEA
jgi:hypothetical protein